MSESTLTSASEQKSTYSNIDTNRSNNKGVQELNVHKILRNAFQEMAEDTVDMKTLLPISILLEEMKSDHSSTRTYCLQNLSTIALVLGPARAKGLLGGFISNLLKDQDEGVEDVPEELQVMLTLLESLPKLINLIGGPEHSMVLLRPLLETLCDRSKDETQSMYIKVIREIAMRMFKNHKEVIQASLLDKIQELRDGTPQQQISAVLLISNLYPSVDEDTLKEFKVTYKMLMLSKESIVRKKVILCLKDIATVAETADDLQMCLELADEIYTNGKDFKSNLFYFLPCLVKNKHFQELQDFEEFMNKLFKMQNINSYNIFIEIFIELVQNMRECKVDCAIILNNYFNLLKLPELEVKQKLCTVIGKLIVVLKESKTSQFKVYNQQCLTYLNDMENETNFMIKQNLVEQITIVLNLALEKRVYFSVEEINFYLKYLLNQLVGGDTDLKFKFISKLKSFSIILQFMQDQMISQEEMKKIIIQLFTIIKGVEVCKNWRMRCQCLSSIQMLLINIPQFKLNKQFLDFKLLEESIIKLIQDRISSVREESSKAMNALFYYYKQNNLNAQAKQMISSSVDLLKHQNYLVRAHYILGLRIAIHFEDAVIPILKQLKDEVPNVKLAMLEVLMNSKIQYPQLLPLNDIDLDVKDVAGRLKELWKK